VAKGDPYAHKERAYAEPFANELVANSTFCEWLLTHAGLGARATGCRVLNEEMKARRSKSAATWWNSHFNGRCQCEGCRGGRETDLLAIFELQDGKRFALHIEFKQPSDKFHKGQAARYALRADCWIEANPPLVVPHSEAGTMLICSASRIESYANELDLFGSVLTFDDVTAAFPQIAFPTS
jgi:hypothetical protein